MKLLKINQIKFFKLSIITIIPNFIQSFIEEWESYQDLHWYNWILLLPSLLFLFSSILGIFINLFKKK